MNETLPETSGERPVDLSSCCNQPIIGEPPRCGRCGKDASIDVLLGALEWVRDKKYDTLYISYDLGIMIDQAVAASKAARRKINDAR